jgi:hypothetical protein
MKQIFPVRKLALAFLMVGAASASLAQSYPSGGSTRSRGEGRGDSRSIADMVERRAEAPAIRPHTMSVFAGALEKEMPSLGLAPAAATAMQDFVRELRDYATLEDRPLRERAGLAPRTVHAVSSLQRDLDAQAEYASELSGAARDVLARWKKLRDQLGEDQRKRVDAIYGAAQLGGK